MKGRERGTYVSDRHPWRTCSFCRIVDKHLQSTIHHDTYNGQVGLAVAQVGERWWGERCCIAVRGIRGSCHYRDTLKSCLHGDGNRFEWRRPLRGLQDCDRSVRTQMMLVISTARHGTTIKWSSPTSCWWDVGSGIWTGPSTCGKEGNARMFQVTSETINLPP